MAVANCCPSMKLLHCFFCSSRNTYSPGGSQCGHGVRTNLTEYADAEGCVKRFAAVFGCAFVVYLAVFGGHYVSGDEAQRVAWAKALIDCHCNDISPYFPGKHFAKYGIGI